MLAPTFAVEVLELDIPKATAVELRELDTICQRHSVVVVRNQQLCPDELVRVGERFGHVSPQRRVGPHPDNPGISILSNKKVDGQFIGVHESGRAWHSDGTTYPTLGLTTLLYAVELPGEGGDTLYADTKAAYEALPEKRRRELAPIRVVHNRSLLFDRAIGPKLTPEERAEMPDLLHPIVVDSPIGGGQALFLTRGSMKGVDGMDQEAGSALISGLIAHVTQEQYVYRHHWLDGDLVIWNNLCTMHSATDFDDTKYDRVVYRVWVRPDQMG